MKSIRLILAAFCGAWLVSCSPKPEDMILGKWTHNPNSPPGFGTRVDVSGPGAMTFEFRPDGTVVTQGGVEVGSVTVDGKVEREGGLRRITNSYSLVDAHTLKIAFAKGERFQGREVTFQVSASRKEMVLKETAPSGLVGLAGPGGILTLRRIE